MKKTITLILFISFASFYGLKAQDIDLKGGLSFATEIDPGLGVQIGAQYQLQEEIDLAAGFTFFLPDKDEFPNGFGGTNEVKTSYWMFDADGHYVFDLDTRINIFPLAGINLTTASVDFNGADSSNTELGLNIGGGAEYEIEDALKAFLEFKYIVSDFDQAVLGLGILYTINY